MPIALRYTLATLATLAALAWLLWQVYLLFARFLVELACLLLIAMFGIGPA